MSLISLCEQIQSADEVFDYAHPMQVSRGFILPLTLTLAGVLNGCLLFAAPVGEPEPGVDAGAEPAPSPETAEPDGGVEPDAEPAVEPAAEPDGGVEPAPEPEAEPEAEPEVEPEAEPPPDAGVLDAGPPDGGSVVNVDGGVIATDGGIVVGPDAGVDFPDDPFRNRTNLERRRLRLSNAHFVTGQPVQDPLPILVRIPADAALDPIAVVDTTGAAVPFLNRGNLNGFQTIYVRPSVAVTGETISQSLFVYWGEGVETLPASNERVFESERFFAAYDFLDSSPMNLAGTADVAVDPENVATASTSTGQGAATGFSLSGIDPTSFDLAGVATAMVIDGTLTQSGMPLLGTGDTTLSVNEEGIRLTQGDAGTFINMNYTDSSDAKFILLNGDYNGAAEVGVLNLRTGVSKRTNDLTIDLGVTSDIYPELVFSTESGAIIDHLWILTQPLIGNTSDLAAVAMMNQLVVVEEQPVAFTQPIPFSLPGGSPVPTQEWNFASCSGVTCPNTGSDSEAPPMQLANMALVNGGAFAGDGRPVAETEETVLCDGSSNENITLVAWFQPDNHLSRGPARIFAHSVNHTNQSFILGQDIGPDGRGRYIFRDHDQDVFEMGPVPDPSKLSFLAVTIFEDRLLLCVDDVCRFQLWDTDLTGGRSDARFRVLSEGSAGRSASGIIHYAGVWCTALNEVTLNAIFDANQ